MGHGLVGQVVFVDATRRAITVDFLLAASPGSGGELLSFTVHFRTRPRACAKAAGTLRRWADNALPVEIRLRAGRGSKLEMAALGGDSVLLHHANHR